MKRFWLVLLSLGLVMAFSVSAFAVDVKVSGDYFVGGLYLNKVQVNDGYDVTKSWMSGATNPSTAFFYQRLRVGTDFIVSPCLKLVTRFDAMERVWGGARSNTWLVNQDALNESAGTRNETENIAFDIVYIDYTSPIGQFQVGYMPDYAFGTVFGDNGSALYDGQIWYHRQMGPLALHVGYGKIVDNSYSAVSSTSWNNYLSNELVYKTDRDKDSYRLAFTYDFKTSQATGDAGILFLYDRDATNRGTHADGQFGDSYLQNVYLIDPYVKAKIGPVALQAELMYFFGDAAKYESYVTGKSNISIDALSAFVDATVNFGMFNAGATVAYLSGDDPGTTDKIEGGINTGGYDWNPCLIMFNTETLGYWVGPIYGHGDSVVDNPMTNAWFFQGRVGVKPTPQLDILLSLSYATADKKPEGYANGDYGTEVDLTATYKITNNLSYMLGGGYLFTGDYFKADNYLGGGSFGNAQVTNDFILINKLTLSF